MRNRGFDAITQQPGLCPELTSIVESTYPDLDLSVALHRHLQTSIGRVDRKNYEDALPILLGIDDAWRGRESQHRRKAAGLKVHQGFSSFRDPETGHEASMLRSLGTAIQREAAAIIDRRGVERPPLEYYGSLGLGSIDLLMSRQLLHVARTLKVLQLNASPQVSASLDKLLSDYVQWRDDPTTKSGGEILLAFNAASEEYLGISVFGLLHTIERDMPSPTTDPRHGLSVVRSAERSNIVMVEAARDPYTLQAVDPLFMCRYPVSTAEWHNFLDSFNYPATITWQSMYSNVPFEVLADPWSPHARLPAAGMRFIDCAIFCFWLWLTTPYRWRLPTEAEWNVAATGGERRKYPWGDHFDRALANTSEDGRGTLFIDQLEPQGPYGIAGLSGNAWEYLASSWLSDDPRDSSAVTIPDLPLGMLSGSWWRALRSYEPHTNWVDASNVVMKGGSSSLPAHYAGLDSRIYSSVTNHGAYGGLRLCVSAVQERSTGRWLPEPSPFTDQRIANPIAASDLGDIAANFLFDATMAAAPNGGACGGGNNRASQPTPWPELIRRWAERQ